MSLPIPSLDDRRFQDLVDEAKGLIPRWCPEWTNHNLSDPGVALIELFAWLTELTLYRLNQVPDRFYTLLLNLVGLDAFPAVPARADLLFTLASPDVPVVTIPEAVPVGTLAVTADEPVVFTTDRGLVLRQPNLISCLTSAAGTESFVDRLEDLRYEHGEVVCFQSDPPQPGDSLYFGFEEALGGHVLRLAVDAHSEGLGIEPARPPLRWEAWSEDGWARVLVTEDTTGGLNQRGDILVVMPATNQALVLGAMRAYWLRARLVAPRPGQLPYQTSPRLRALDVVTVGGVLSAHHGEQYPGEELGVSDGSAGQVFRLIRSPVLPRRSGERVEVVSDAGSDVWQEVEHFGDSGPDDHHVVWNASGEIRFGPLIRYPDGSTRQHGAIPPRSAVVSVTGYRRGGGTRGNLGANTLVSLRTAIPYVDRVTNPAPSTGGVDAETVENAKQRGLLTLRTGGRAVTVGDFERLTLEASERVARVRCLPPRQSGEPIRLLVVPRVDPDQILATLDDFALDDELVGEIAGHLDQRRILGASIEIDTPMYRGASVVCRVTSRRGHDRNLVRERVLESLYRFIHPVLGGLDGTGVAFGWDLSAGFLMQLIADVDGVDSVEEVLLFPVDARTESREEQPRELIESDDETLVLSFRHRVVVR